MAITYSWVVKYLKQDERGYASTLYCELQGEQDAVIKIASSSTSFGGADYKPYVQWTQEQIDVFADTMKPGLETEIQYQFDNPIQEPQGETNV
jgi:hypothetical protein